MPSVIVNVDYPNIRSQSRAPTPFVMRQLLGFDPRATLGYTYQDFEFPYVPREMSFEDLAPEIVELERPGKLPLVERKSPKLAKISFDFRIADRNSQGVVAVDDTLRTLRQLVARGQPVSFIGMDKVVQYQVKMYDNSLSNAWYAITGFSIRTVQRVPRLYPGSSGTSDRNAIAIADGSLQLTEQRNPWPTVIQVPRIVYPVDAPIGAGGGAPGPAGVAGGPRTGWSGTTSGGGT